MRVKDLKLVMDQYDDNDLMYFQLTCGDVHQLGKTILPSKHNDDLFEIKSAQKDDKTSALVVKIR